MAKVHVIGAVNPRSAGGAIAERVRAAHHDVTVRSIGEINLLQATKNAFSEGADAVFIVTVVHKPGSKGKWIPFYLLQVRENSRGDTLCRPSIECPDYDDLAALAICDLAELLRRAHPQERENELVPSDARPK